MSTALKLLVSDYKSLESSQKDDREKIMSVSDVRVSRSLEDYEKKMI